MELILSVAAIHLLACLSPGPDVFLVVLNSLRDGWRSGLATTGGILTGVSVQILAGMAGISLLLARGGALAAGVALAGGAWLLYLGVQGLRAAWRGSGPGATGDSAPPGPRRAAAAWSQGLLVNLLNPKAWLYFLSLFSALLGPEVPLRAKALAGMAMLGVQAAAFAGVALAVDRPLFKRRWAGWQRWLEAAVSLILAGLGLWIWGGALAALVGG